MSVNSYARGGFGGGRSSGSFSRGSSFGGSRSTSGASIFRSSTPSYSRPATVYHSSPTTTVIHTNSGGGFWSGMMMGSMMNRPVVVPVGGMGYAGQPVVVQAYSFMDYIFGAFVLIILVGIVWAALA